MSLAAACGATRAARVAAADREFDLVHMEVILPLDPSGVCRKRPAPAVPVTQRSASAPSDLATVRADVKSRRNSLSCRCDPPIVGSMATTSTSGEISMSRKLITAAFAACLAAPCAGAIAATHATSYSEPGDPPRVVRARGHAAAQVRERETRSAQRARRRAYRMPRFFRAQALRSRGARPIPRGHGPRARLPRALAPACLGSHANASRLRITSCCLRRRRLVRLRGLRAIRRAAALDSGLWPAGRRGRGQHSYPFFLPATRYSRNGSRSPWNTSTPRAAGTSARRPMGASR